MGKQIGNISFDDIKLRSERYNLTEVTENKFIISVNMN